MAAELAQAYPWYGSVAGGGLEQGQILLDCPRFIIPPEALNHPDKHSVQVATVDAIILTQSCDLVVRADGKWEAADVILCELFFKKDLIRHEKFKRNETWDEVRKGRSSFYHVLDRCTLPEHPLDYMLVDFHKLFTLNTALVSSIALSKGKRPCLLPPYREHLSQAFARLFMRVGLPADILPFAGRKK